jgi:hypothetical protein
MDRSLGSRALEGTASTDLTTIDQHERRYTIVDKFAQVRSAIGIAGALGFGV